MMAKEKMMRVKAILRMVYNSIRMDGFWRTCKKVLRKIARKLHRRRALPYKLSRKERRRQASHAFPEEVKISILVPLYNTPEPYLTELIRSVREQTCTNWELCLADGSDDAHDDVRRICSAEAEKDSRIVYQKLEKNLGISGNTNRCIGISTGSYFGLLDHDDLLHPAAIFEVMNAICGQNADMIYTDEATFNRTPRDAYSPNFKPDYAPDTLRSQNYIGHFTVFSRKLLEKVGPFRSQFDGSQDYDMVLRLTETAEHIVHIPKALYFWRAGIGSTAADVGAKPYTIEAAKAALTEHLKRLELEGTVEDSSLPTTYRIRYQIKGSPLVSIMIPNKDHASDLKKCIKSILTRSTYRNIEIVIVENNSVEQETFACYEQLHRHENIRVVEWEGKFNFSAINNFGFQHTHGEYVVLLNNDIEVITPGWIEEMLMFAQRADAGAVGAMLYYPDDTIQHAGVILGIGGVAGHAHKYFRRGEPGYMGRASFAQNLSAVTAACMMIPRHVFAELNGFDEAFAVAFNDVDLCMRIRQAGYLIVFTPYAELYHYESKSRGLENTAEKRKRFQNEVLRFMGKWKRELEAGDPYYNPNLTLGAEDFSLKDQSG